MKAIRFKRGTITCKAGAGEMVPNVPALIYGSTGLAINQRDPSRPKGRYVSVTHIKTGYRLSRKFSLHRHARLYCKATATLTDWHKILLPDDVSKAVKADLILLHRLIEVHGENWRIEYVKAKLVGVDGEYIESGSASAESPCK